MAAGRALALALSLSASGCASGYVVIRPEAEPGRSPQADWSALRFTLEGEPRDRCALERVLLERYGVVQLRRGVQEDGVFHLAISRAHAQPSGALLALGMVSFFTYAAVPGYLHDPIDVTYTLHAPGGASFSGTERHSEGVVSWAPFLLLGASMVGSLNGAMDEADLARLDAAEALAARFLRSAAPFVEERRGPVAGASP